MKKQEFTEQLFYPTPLKRFFFFFSFDILLISASLFLAFALRLDLPAASTAYLPTILTALPLFLAVKLSGLAFFRLYRTTWRYIGLRDLVNVGSAVILSEVVLSLMVLLPVPVVSYASMSLQGFPRSIFILDGTISLLLLSLLRASKRIVNEVIVKKGNRTKGLRTCIIGAGNTGEMVLRDMMKQGNPPFFPVVFLDDDKRKVGSFIHNVQVLGEVASLSGAIERYRVQAIVIAIPMLSFKTIRLIYDAAKASGLETVKIVPRIYDTNSAGIHLQDLEDISIEDLIGRQAVATDNKAIDRFIRDKVVLVTGAGGSIGSEIVMQACSHSPKKLVLFEIDETELHNLGNRMKSSFPSIDHVSFIVGDVRDEERVTEIFERFRPDIVFHAAAYKHVPMMEYNPREAVKVNVFGTYNLASAAVQAGVQRFVMISTDKAVRPTSIMGATKRVAEYICAAFNNDRSQESGVRSQNNDRAQPSAYILQPSSSSGQLAGLPAIQPATLPVCQPACQTEFISVRFGNVLGSRGSVLPLFMEQLKKGGPMTVTHPEMKRYFMTIPEAVSLVLQASVIGRGGEVMVLDMGKPVKIVRLAEELIRIHGLKPYEDIPIEFVGLRPGEKLFEEILTAEEGTVASMHEKVFVARNSQQYSLEDVGMILSEFREVLEGKEDWNRIKDVLTRHVKHYESDSLVS